MSDCHCQSRVRVRLRLGLDLLAWLLTHSWRSIFCLLTARSLIWLITILNNYLVLGLPSPSSKRAMKYCTDRETASHIPNPSVGSFRHTGGAVSRPPRERSLTVESVALCVLIVNLLSDKTARILACSKLSTGTKFFITSAVNNHEYTYNNNTKSTPNWHRRKQTVMSQLLKYSLTFSYW